MGQGFDMAFQRQLAVESWTLYGIAMFVICLRAFARWRRARSVGLLATDDWVMMTVVPALYTTLITCLNVIATGGGSNLFPPDQFDTFSQKDIEERIKGSKIVIISEQAMLNVIWTLKACMLCMYARMSQGTRHLKFVHWLGIYVAVGWIAVEVTFFTACRPFEGYWGMPPPDPQCTTYEHYALVQAAFNTTSDVCMLILPLPMIVSLSLPLKQKVVLGIVFSMGVFVIIAAILTKVYNLTDVYSTVYMLWYIREASVAVFVANLPGIWPLLRESFPCLRSISSYPQSSGGLPRYASQYGQTSKATRARIHTTQRNDDDIDLAEHSFSKITTHSRSSPDKGDERLVHFGRTLSGLTHSRTSSPESDERALTDRNGGWGSVFEVHVDKTIEVHTESHDNSRGMGMGVTDTQVPCVRIEGPEGEVMSSQPSR